MRKYVCTLDTQKILMYDQYCSNETELQKITEDYRQKNPVSSYPCRFGEKFSLADRQRFTIYLIDQYLVNYDSQHCTPLPQTHFRTPTRCV